MMMTIWKKGKPSLGENDVGNDKKNVFRLSGSVASDESEDDDIKLWLMILTLIAGSLEGRSFHHPRLEQGGGRGGKIIFSSQASDQLGSIIYLESHPGDCEDL